MTILTSLLAATTTTTKAASKSSGSSAFSYLILVAILGGFYLFVIRPRQARQKQARAGAAAALEIGSTVMSVGGIKGTVVGMDGTDVHVEVAPGVVLTFIRRAVNAQAPPPVSSVEDDFPADDDGTSLTGGFERDEPEDRPGTGTEGP